MLHGALYCFLSIFYVYNIDVPWSHRLDYFETNYTNTGNLVRALALQSHMSSGPGGTFFEMKISIIYTYTDMSLAICGLFNMCETVIIYRLFLC